MEEGDVEMVDSSRENVNVSLEDLPLDKLYERFSLGAADLLPVIRAFEAFKTRLNFQNKYGLDLFRALKEEFCTHKSRLWKAKDVLQLLDKRANHKEYMKQTAAKGIRVLVVGAGPMGLRTAIDCILLGCQVEVIEKRNKYSRNNVLHLWPFNIEDLKQLGAKKFYGKFCAGAIDHISIRSLQCILLKVCLLLGIRVHTEVEFQEVLEPQEDDGIGWRAKLKPADCPLNQFEFDVLVGGDGRRSVIPGFDRKELRGKLALAITANFTNYFTRDEAAVQEISGVAFIFNQKFFKDLRADTGIDLENIVYYKDDTHYFVMTAKKDSLLKKGVLKSDYSDTRALLHPSNIDYESLYDYSTEAADWATDLPRLDFAVNHYEKPDVALFDFTSIYQAEYATRAVRRGGRDLFICLVGDALLEPFWPTGTGCGRGFLSAMDTAWLIRGLGQQRPVMDLLCEREAIFQRLPQTTPEKMNQNIKAYTIDPQSRYPNLNFHRVKHGRVAMLYDTEETATPTPALRTGSIKVKRTVAARDAGEAEEEGKENVVPTVAKKPREEKTPPPHLMSPSRRPLKEKGSIHLAYYAEPEGHQTLKDPSVLLAWLQQQVKDYGLKVTDLSTSWSDGMALCALIHHYHPELIPDFDSLSPSNPIKNNKLAFDISDRQFGISRLLQPNEMAKPDKLALFTYLSLFYEFFLNVEPVPQIAKGSTPKQSTPRRKSLHRRDTKKLLVASPPSAERTWNTTSIHRLAMSPPPASPMGSHGLNVQGYGSEVVTSKTANALVAEMSLTSEAPKKPPRATSSAPRQPAKPKPAAPQFGSSSSDVCYFCDKKVYLMERMSANGVFFHRNCFRCSHCNCQLKIGAYSLSKGEGGAKGKFFCSVHYRQLFLSNPEAINYSRAGAPKRSTSEVAPTVERSPDPEDGLKQSDVRKALESVTEMGTEDNPFSSSDEDDELGSEISTGEEEEEEEEEEEDEHVSLMQQQAVSPVMEALSEEMEVGGEREASPEMDDQQTERKTSFYGSDKEPLSPIQQDVILEEEEEEEEEEDEEFEVISTHDEDVKKLINSESGDVRETPPSSEGGVETRPEELIPPGESVNEPSQVASSEGQTEIKNKSPVKNDKRRGGGAGRGKPRAITSAVDPKDAQAFRRLTKPARTRSKTALEGGKRAPAPPPPSPKAEGGGESAPPLQRRSATRKGSNGGGVVARFSQQYEALDRAARHNLLENEEPVIARDRAKSGLPPVRPIDLPKPYEVRELSQSADHTSPKPARPAPPPPAGIRPWTERAITRRPPEDIPQLLRSGSHVDRRPTRKGRGQRSVTRPLIGTYDCSDVAIQDRRKQQQRFREAQLIQREMSQLERQYEELEEVSREIEQALRDAESTSQEDHFMKSWLNLVNERNGLVRKTAELSLTMKELELEDRQYDVDKELNDLSSATAHLTKQEQARFEELCELKIKIVEERNELVDQTEEERQRELEEDETTETMLEGRFGPGSRNNSASSEDASPGPLAGGVAGPRRTSESAVHKRNKRKKNTRVKTWFGFSN